MKQLHPGVNLAGRYGFFRCGCWVLEHGGHAAVVETPPWNRARNPLNAVRRFIRARKNRFKLDWLLLTHAHTDHVSALREFSLAFPEAQILVHESFLNDPYFAWLIGNNQDLPFAVFRGDHCVLELGGEPLHLIYAPKHSWTDVMTIFRGAMITGDWWLGPGDPNPSRIPSGAALDSIDRLLEFSRGYGIDTLFSAHANDLRHGIDFGQVMKSTRDWHQTISEGRIPRIKRRRRKRR